ncbi:acyl carrier protein [Krasilnikovia sp. MM14-A1004]|uniref:acyl carrier protein n=1 Tax=Krasilnikovia sp. MM14-A1004 TaxID=3373541 RepID=UPI00399CB299
MSDVFTIDDLKRILREAAGAESAADDAGDIHDLSFSDLGYDSLVLLETSSRIEREYGISLDDSTVTDAPNPRALLNEVNARLADREGLVK